MDWDAARLDLSGVWKVWREGGGMDEHESTGREMGVMRQYGWLQFNSGCGFISHTHTHTHTH